MDDERNPLFLFFSAELKRLRLESGLSQEALGQRISFSAEIISKVESGRNPPSPEFTKALDEHGYPEMRGLFTRLRQQAGGWRFRTFIEAEQHAALIRVWNPLLVPGLAQTEGYARTVMEAWRAVDTDRDIDTDLATRLGRQSIFDRPQPPSVGVMIDEGMLYREVGDAKVMRNQLLHLAELSERPRVTVQVIPTGVGTHVGLMGAFLILGFPDDSPGMVYLESPDRGETTTDPKRLARVALTWDVLRDEALGARASRDLFRKVAEEKWPEKSAPTGARAATAAAPTASA